MENVELVTIRIPSENLDELQTKFAKLIRKAERLNVPAPVLTVGPEQTQTIKSEHFENVLGFEQTVSFYMVTVSGCAPKLPGGWRLIATLDHSEAGNIVRAVPGETVPETYRVKPQFCDHCNASRRRINTFVLQNEVGEVKQIGRNCIAAFLGGIEPEDLVKRLEFLRSLEEVGSGEEFDGFYGSRGSESIRILDLFALAHAVFQNVGWVTSKQAREAAETGGYKETSASVCLFLLATPKTNEEKERLAKWKAKHPNFKGVTDENKAFANEVLAFCKDETVSANGSNEYRWNLKVIASKETVSLRNINLIVSAVGVVARNKGQEAERSQRSAQWAEKVQASQHVGTVGNRETFSLRFENSRAFDGAYGTSYLLKFTDANGNDVSWFSSKPPEAHNLAEGRSYRVTATVKAHSEYKGVKQTQLTRGKVSA